MTIFILPFIECALNKQITEDPGVIEFNLEGNYYMYIYILWSEPKSFSQTYYLCIEE